MTRLACIFYLPFLLNVELAHTVTSQLAPINTFSTQIDTNVIRLDKKIPSSSIKVRGRRIHYFDSTKAKYKKGIINSITSTTTKESTVVKLYVDPPRQVSYSLFDVILFGLFAGRNSGSLVFGASLSSRVFEWENENQLDGLVFAFGYSNRGSGDSITAGGSEPREQDISIDIEGQIHPFDSRFYISAGPGLVFDMTHSLPPAISVKFGLGYELSDSWEGTLCLSFQYFKTKEFHNSLELEFRIPIPFGKTVESYDAQ